VPGAEYQQVACLGDLTNVYPLAPLMDRAARDEREGAEASPED
jgi:hypothetical protein